MKRIIAVLMIIALSLSVFTACTNNEEEQRLNELSERMLQYNTKKRGLESDIAKAWKEYDQTLSGGECCFTLFVDNMTRNLIEEVYPLLTDFSFKATVVMSDGEMPGEKGCISKNDYDKLIRAGWDFAIGSGSVDYKSENSVELLKKYLEDYKLKLEENGYEMPKTFAFSEKQYDEKYIDLLLEYGFNVVRHFGEAGSKYSYSIERNGLYLLGSGRICADKTTMKADMQNAYKEKSTYSATVRCIDDVYADEELDCSVVKYELMLDFIEDECDEAHIFTATELYDYKTNTLSGSENFMTEFEKKIATLEKELSEVNEELKKIHASLE